MKLKEFINEDKVYLEVEEEIKKWIEETYKGLSIDFYPQTMEIVRTNEQAEYNKEETKKITEVVNIKIDNILEEYAEKIYIAERLTRIWKHHPNFNIEVKNIEDIKKNKKFLKYLKELIIKPTKCKVVNIQDYRRKEKLQSGSNR